jgi:hypothetical protein
MTCPQRQRRGRVTSESSAQSIPSHPIRINRIVRHRRRRRRRTLVDVHSLTRIHPSIHPTCHHGLLRPPSSRVHPVRSWRQQPVQVQDHRPHDRVLPGSLPRRHLLAPGAAVLLLHDRLWHKTMAGPDGSLGSDFRMFPNLKKGERESPPRAEGRLENNGRR